MTKNFCATIDAVITLKRRAAEQIGCNVTLLTKIFRTVIVMKKSLRKLLAAALIAGSFFTASPVNAEVKTYEGTDEYVMSEFETIDIAKQRARQKAERNAQEKAGVYISSYSETKNLELVSDEIVSIACGILSVVDVKYDVTPLADVNGFAIRATVKANIETDDVNKWLQKKRAGKIHFRHA